MDSDLGISKSSLDEMEQQPKGKGNDEESFVLLDNETLMYLIPIDGPRSKFKKYLNSFIHSTNFSSETFSDSTAPLCNTDVSFSPLNSAMFHVSC
ncbi:hypothetical protein NPIL_673161 [Nephila pilipes]|uniref:Uncharacterized protein n=1 Tax=Nephila pilipes TaxID=299642 RepID=A0A8X6PRM1_NEPPI|nr:hypothetical protein NPIL_673161 [Nephila pilipes]